MKRLVALIAAALVVAVALVAVVGAMPAQGQVDEGLEYGYLPSGTKSESVDFTLAAARDDTRFIFGSSELTTRPEVVLSAPENVLRSYDCGYQLMYVGEAYDQDLWMALAAGAYAEGMPNKKVAIVVSLQWFFDGGLEPGIFKMRFSYPLYDAFCANEAISPETKAYVQRRLREEGVDGALIDAGSGSLPQDVLNRWAFKAMGDARLRQALPEVRQRGLPLADVAEPPDYDDLRARAAEQAQVFCSGNDYAVIDDYWAEYLEPNYDAQAGSKSAETLTETPEYDDFQCFLDVCAQTGLEPCVIMMPVNGKWYDHLGLTRDVRNAFYQRIADMCERAGVDYLDMSPTEYEPYYLRDIMHLGWLGWVDVEEHLGAFFAEGGRP